VNLRKGLFLTIFLCITVFGLGQNTNPKTYIDSLIKRLTIRERIAQLFIVDVSSLHSNKKKLEETNLIKDEKVGGIIIMRERLNSYKNYVNQLHKYSKLPLLVCVDGEWGASMRFSELERFPRQMQLGALSSDSLVYQMGRLVANECKALNIHVNFAPCIDINNNPDNPVINARSFGEDKYKVYKFGAAYLNGMRDEGVFGCAKHFPGHGDTDVDSHLGLPVLPYSIDRLDSLELYPFKQFIADSVEMIMVGHLQVPAIDSSGRPASISKKIVDGYLKGVLGFNGIVCTDALNMKAVAESAGIEAKFIPLEAYKAGVDIFLMAEDVSEAISEIENKVKAGELSVKELNKKVRKVLELKYSANLFKKEYSPYVKIDSLDSLTKNSKNISLINELAKNSVTLVYNNNSIVPVSDTVKVAYFGYTGEKFASDFAKVVTEYSPNADTLILCSPVSMEDLQMAKDSLSKYDLIITSFNNTDVRPHENFGIDNDQLDFITSWAKEKPMIAVYFGSPYAFNIIPNYKNFKAVVVGYTNTEANNCAAAKLVFGGIKAKGVIPVSTNDFRVGSSATQCN
jgi:Beta-glucosidase-related glycosidases